MLRIFDTRIVAGGLNRPANCCGLAGSTAQGAVPLPTLLGRRAGAEVAGTNFAGGCRSVRRLARARNCIFLWLQGGPPQHETFDPKPDAPAEIRGEFRRIATNVPGIDICELLPRTGPGSADKLAIVQPISTRSDLAGASGYWITNRLSLHRQRVAADEADRLAYFGSIVRHLKPSTS